MGDLLIKDNRITEVSESFLLIDIKLSRSSYVDQQKRS